MKHCDDPLTGLRKLYSLYGCALCTCNHGRSLLMSMVNGCSYLIHTLLCGDGAQGGAGVEIVEAEAQDAAAAEFIYQQGLALLTHIWVQHSTTNMIVTEAIGTVGRREEKDSSRGLKNGEFRGDVDLTV